MNTLSWLLPFTTSIKTWCRFVVNYNYSIVRICCFFLIKCIHLGFSITRKLLAIVLNKSLGLKKMSLFWHCAPKWKPKTFSVCCNSCIYLLTLNTFHPQLLSVATCLLVSEVCHWTTVMLINIILLHPSSSHMKLRKIGCVVCACVCCCIWHHQQ